MRTLVDERSFICTIADDGTANVDTPIIRPRFQKYAGLNAEAREAVYVDRAQFVWAFRSVADLPGFEANLVLTRYSRQGGWGTSDFIGDFPATSLDVSAALLNNRGVISYTAKYDGVLKGSIQLTNRSGSAVTLAVQVQVFGVPQVEDEGEEQ